MDGVGVFPEPFVSQEGEQERAVLFRPFVLYRGGMSASSPDLLSLVLLVVALGNAALGFVVIYRHRQEEHLTFALTAFFVALWTLTNALFRLSSSSEAATLWRNSPMSRPLAPAPRSCTLRGAFRNSAVHA